MTEHGAAPVVSVVLTTYNQGKWLAQAIESVLAQTLVEWELLVVDNGSTDDTPAVCARYAHDARIHVRRSAENQHHTVVSNAAIQACRGEYVAFLYGDDYYLPDKLQTQVDALRLSAPRVCGVYCSTFILDEATGQLELHRCGSLRGPNLFPVMFAEGQPFMPLAPLVRRESLLRYPFYEELFMEGEGVFNRLAWEYEWDFVDAALGVMRSHGENMGKAIDWNLRRVRRANELMGADPRFPEPYRPLLGAQNAKLYAMHGWQVMRRERRYGTGRGWLLEAIRFDPRIVRRPRVLLGLGMSLLPRLAADSVNAIMDRVYGAPPKAPREPLP